MRPLNIRHHKIYLPIIGVSIVVLAILLLSINGRVSTNHTPAAKPAAHINTGQNVSQSQSESTGASPAVRPAGTINNGQSSTPSTSTLKTPSASTDSTTKPAGSNVATINSGQPTSSTLTQTPATTPAAITAISARLTMDSANPIFSWVANGTPAEGYIFSYSFSSCNDWALPCSGSRAFDTKASSSSFNLLATIPNIDAQVKAHGNTNIEYYFSEIRGGKAYTPGQIASYTQLYFCPWDNGYSDVRVGSCGFTR